MAKAVAGSLFSLAAILLPLGFEVSGIESLRLAWLFWGLGISSLIGAIVVWIGFWKDRTRTTGQRAYTVSQGYKLPIKLDEDWIETRVQLKLHDWEVLGSPIAPPYIMSGDVIQRFRREAVDEWKQEHGYPVEGNDDTKRPSE